MSAALILVVGGCVGQNPWWDPPVAGDEDGDGRGDDGDAESTLGDRGDDATVDPAGSDDDTSGDTSGSGTTILDVSASADGAEDDDSSTTDGGPSCDPPLAICDGECLDVRSDHHHCGPTCIDCMDVHGPGTHCVDSVCDVDDNEDDDD